MTSLSLRHIASSKKVARKSEPTTTNILVRCAAFSSLLVAAILCVACRAQGSEFLGKWVNVTNQEDTMEIVQNGDQFLILSQNSKIGAIFKDGSLEIAGAMGSVRITYVKESDTLIAPGFFGQSEYQRAR